MILKFFSYIFDKTLIRSIICDTYDSNNEKTFKEQKTIKISKIVGLINNTNE